MSKWLCAALTLSIAVVACSKKATPTAPDPVTIAPAACTYAVSTTTFNLAGTGGTATLTVSTGTTCAWSMTNVAPFITITSVATQAGPGNVSLSVPENSGDARTGTILIAGQTVTVTQAASDPVYGNWGGTIVKGSGCPASLPASVDYTGVIRRTTGATNEFVIAIPVLGLANQALALSITGNTLQFFVPIDTLYTFNGTLSSDRRSLTGTFSGGTCSGTWNGTRR